MPGLPDRRIVCIHGCFRSFFRYAENLSKVTIHYDFRSQIFGSTSDQNEKDVSNFHSLDYFNAYISVVLITVRIPSRAIQIPSGYCLEPSGYRLEPYNMATITTYRLVLTLRTVSRFSPDGAQTALDGVWTVQTALDGSGWYRKTLDGIRTALDSSGRYPDGSGQ